MYHNILYNNCQEVYERERGLGCFFSGNPGKYMRLPSLYIMHLPLHIYTYLIYTYSMSGSSTCLRLLYHSGGDGGIGMWWAGAGVIARICQRNFRPIYRTALRHQGCAFMGIVEPMLRVTQRCEEPASSREKSRGESPFQLKVYCGHYLGAALPYREPW
jgi:hypothetical protein